MADIKDGVTLIADAIRREIAEQEKANQSVNASNVIDVTAQFKNGGKTVPVEVSNKTDTSNDVNGEPDGTYPDGVPDATNKATNND